MKEEVISYLILSQSWRMREAFKMTSLVTFTVLALSARHFLLLWVLLTWRGCILHGDESVSI